MIRNTAKLNRQQWESAQIARLAKWAGERLDSFLRDDGARRLSVIHRGLRQHRLLCELLWEIHSFFHRIEMTCKQELWHLGVSLGSPWEVSPKGYLKESSQTTYRKLGTR